MKIVVENRGLPKAPTFPALYKTAAGSLLYYASANSKGFILHGVNGFITGEFTGSTNGYERLPDGQKVVLEND